MVTVSQHAVYHFKQCCLLDVFLLYWRRKTLTVKMLQVYWVVENKGTCFHLAYDIFIAICFLFDTFICREINYTMTTWHTQSLTQYHRENVMHQYPSFLSHL